MRLLPDPGISSACAMSLPPRSPTCAPVAAILACASPPREPSAAVVPRSACGSASRSSGMEREVETHALLRILNGRSLEGAVLPAWAWATLHRAPWVVVRRAAAREGLIPVGVRGTRRSERLAAWLHPAAVLECVRPRELAARRAWLSYARRIRVPALAALEGVESIMRAQGLSRLWGPCG